ncbi:MAG TPA: outer-membrane lipoprotein carrier protein LolA [Chitinispirillaceae bacterium]|nr:outer-membrane lipoprotein carrier protein LolA [Chitinispirillaceae bacterium]
MTAKSIGSIVKKGAQVVIDNLSKLDLDYHPSQLLTTFLTKYSYRQSKVSGDKTVLNWTADDSSKESFYTNIVIEVITKSGEITKLKVTDRSGNIQTFTFKKTVFGAKMPKEVFTFEVPDNIQVLDNRQ